MDEQTSYLKFIKDHGLVVFILTISHALIIPALFLIRYKEELWDDITDDGEKFVEEIPVEGVYIKPEESEKFIPFVRKTPNPYMTYLNMTLVFGSMVVWFITALILMMVL